MSNFKIRFLLTGKCTAICKYCHNEGQSKFAKSLKIVTIERIIEKLERKSNLPNEVILSGGEPTLHKHLKEIAKFLKSKNIYVSMDSHAGHVNLLEPVLPYLNELKIHVDSFNEEEQYSSMGVELSSVIESISLAKKYPIKLIINHPLNNKVTTLNFIKGARNMGINCKIIEINNNDTLLENIDFIKYGYIYEGKNTLKFHNSDHRLFLKKCKPSQNEKTLFIGAEGIRYSLNFNENQKIEATSKNKTLCNMRV